MDDVRVLEAGLIAVPSGRGRPAIDVTGSLGDSVPGRGYLLCFDGTTSWTVPLPGTGSLTIGRSLDAELRFDNVAVSRHHARVAVAGDWLELIDLGSRHGTRLNGRPVSGPSALASGDVVGLGTASIVVHRPPTPLPRRPVLAAAALRAHLAEEVARAAGRDGELAVLCLSGDRAVDAEPLWTALAPRLPAGCVAGRAGGDGLVIVGPGQGDVDALLASIRPSLPGARIGVARCPADGVDGDALLAAAVAAAAAAPAHGVQAASDLSTTIAIGPHRAIVVDPAMIRVHELLRRLARHRLPVLIGGETGTGKELAAAALHHFSTHADGPLIAVNCATLPESLADAELFGHARGAFTGALQHRAGVFESAHGGTLFLDEIGELPPSTQARLLRVLETGRVVRLGETSERPADVRVVAATHRDLAADVAAGRFRADLLFRIGAARVLLPPLRDRPREIPVLARALLEAAGAAAGRPGLQLSAAAGHALCMHRWPGNVRELRNAMAVAVSAIDDDEVLVEPWHLPDDITGATAGIDRTSSTARALADGSRPDFRPIAEEIAALERRRMIEALRVCEGVHNRAAALIAMPLRTFGSKHKRYQIRPADWAVT